jgi:hypothetical protein
VLLLAGTGADGPEDGPDVVANGVLSPWGRGPRESTAGLATGSSFSGSFFCPGFLFSGSSVFCSVLASAFRGSFSGFFSVSGNTTSEQE